MRSQVGGFGIGMLARSEGALLKSANLLAEPDPARITWQTLPDGDVGLRTAPGGGPIAEEHNFSVLSDGSIYCVYRTTDGWPACAYSRDGGHTWPNHGTSVSPPAGRCDTRGRRTPHGIAPMAGSFTGFTTTEPARSRTTMVLPVAASCGCAGARSRMVRSDGHSPKCCCMIRTSCAGAVTRTLSKKRIVTSSRRRRI